MVQMWRENRAQAGLPVPGCLHGPLLPAPRKDDDGWTMRRVTSTEISNIYIYIYSRRSWHAHKIAS